MGNLEDARSISSQAIDLVPDSYDYGLVLRAPAATSDRNQEAPDYPDAPLSAAEVHLRHRKG